MTLASNGLEHAATHSTHAAHTAWWTGWFLFRCPVPSQYLFPVAVVLENHLLNNADFCGPEKGCNTAGVHECSPYHF